MNPWLIAALVAAALVVLAHFKTGRADGTLVKRLHPYRRLMFFIMRTRNESMVYYDDAIDAEGILDYLATAKEAHGVDMTHIIVAAMNITLAENPTMNRFIVGRRMYQRRHRELTFSMKRKAMDKGAKLAVVKLQMKEDESFSALVERMNDSIRHQRSGVKTHEDREYQLFDLFPRTVLRFFTWFFHALDYVNLLPYAFTKDDGLYTSCVIANLGSLGMQPAYHHLYEWGTASLFVMVGRIEERAVVVDGEVVIKKILPTRYSYDERIDDGLSAAYGMQTLKRVLEHPAEALGCLAPDGTDTRPMWPRPGAG
jgi:hypothetical protein